MIAKIYYKPTNVIQHCAHCKQYVCKGELTARLLIGCDNKYPIYAYYHPDCVLDCLKKEINEAKNKIGFGIEE